MEKPIKGVLNFTPQESHEAWIGWGFNCGPGALCAALGMKPEQLRPFLGEFEQKGYMNPTAVFDALKVAGADYRQVYRGDTQKYDGKRPWPEFGLVRIQWGGPWTKAGVPMRARYRATHWIAVRGPFESREIFDINAMDSGGWIRFKVWESLLVPDILRDLYPKADGTWWPTHGIEVLS